MFYPKSQIWKRNNARLRSSVQPKMHGVFPRNAVLLSLLLPSSLSEQDQDDWLESGEALNEKLEHQVPPTSYSHTDTCSNCMQPTASKRRYAHRNHRNTNDGIQIEA